MVESTYNSKEEDTLSKTKPYTISKQLVMEAYQCVKANRGAAGVDQQSLEAFDKDLKDNLYKIWNRMSSGTYFPPPVKAVSIAKKSGGERILGVPTVSDRIAQTVLKLTFESLVEPHFHEDSYGYRPNKSALDAVGVTRQRCWRYDYVVEFDIKGLFDNLDHTLLMKAVRKHTNNKWVILYVERWLKAPMQMPDGTLIERTKGTPQGGVVSPVLSNLFLHYVFDVWMGKHHSLKPWCRYADDGLVHCKTEKEAQQLLADLKQRFEACGLELHPEKTKIIYCKDGRRKGEHSDTMFTFLGYTFRRRTVRNSKDGSRYLGFVPAISSESRKSIQAEMRRWKVHFKTSHTLEDMAKLYNPFLRGWMNFYGHYSPSSMYPIWRVFNRMLSKWAQRKYQKLYRRKTRTRKFLEQIADKHPRLFAHWSITGMAKGFI